MTERRCACGLPEKWAKDSHFPVRYDAGMNEFSIVHRSRGQGEWLMKYCPSCGGRLPESRRGDFFTEPDTAEVREVRELMERVRDVETMRQVLGEPDDTSESHPLDQETIDSFRIYGPAPEGLGRHFGYRSRWKTLALTVMEGPDGTVTYAYYGQYKGDLER